MKILNGNSNRPLAEAISAYLNVPLTQAAIRRFSDLEIFVEVLENVRGEDVFVVQSTNYPANDNLMELLVIIDALRRGSARRITAVIPYYGYARQDRKTGPRTPISAKLVANLIQTAGADRVLTMDLHAGQIQGFFDIPTDNLYASPSLVRDIKENTPDGDEVMVVSPDVGGVLRARSVAKRLEADLAIIDKRREKAGVSEDEHHRLARGAALHPGRRYRRQRRHPVQRGPGLDGSGRQLGCGLCQPWRAQRRRGGPGFRLAAGGPGDDRQHHGHRGGQGQSQHPPDHGGTGSGRGDPAHFRGKIGFQPVRLGV